MSGPARTHDLDSDDRLLIESLDIDAQGIAHRSDGKVVFVEGALPFESVGVVVKRSKPSFEIATVTRVHRESSQRVTPQCPHFGLQEGACGGCKLQHMHPSAQVAAKQRVMEDSLWHLGKVKPSRVLRPIEGPAWGYRYRARLSVRYVRKKDTVLVGFHERKSSFVADMKVCHVLPLAVSDLLMPLRALVSGMRARETCPQIELAMGDVEGGCVIALVLRHLEPLHADDLDRLRKFAAAHSGLADKRQVVQWWLQAQGPDTIRPLDDGGIELAYSLAEFGVRMPFKPTDFTQVNPQINRVLVGQALRLLEAQRSDRVIDWFCGLGNFTLPLAGVAGDVLGVEGSKVLLARAEQNARANRAMSGRASALAPVRFAARNLFDMTPELLVADGTAQLWLLDPPREGALALVRSLGELHLAPADPSTWAPPRRIVYVSCNPATLARDAGLLVHQAGYECVAAGVVNMFPHTAHVESIALFELAA